ncbi:hypothetical protein HMPREF9449_02794 [Odoribacter laneus YIT 12061]|uniref:Uncharacterized protein n=1 Tax=Odoribacter laneus YIT 12061 TaxID=742817 RepID=H1DKK8_9BACT|nr:hypothetical protein HMPREF9449_02794 [Odoribacter laneus YIT 12061]
MNFFLTIWNTFEKEQENRLLLFLHWRPMKKAIVTYLPLF